eukprot:1147661-Pelagomonas_calceolata.AAC.6
MAMMMGIPYADGDDDDGDDDRWALGSTPFKWVLSSIPLKWALSGTPYKWAFSGTHIRYGELFLGNTGHRNGSFNSSRCERLYPNVVNGNVAHSEMERQGKRLRQPKKQSVSTKAKMSLWLCLHILRAP